MRIATRPPGPPAASPAGPPARNRGASLRRAPGSLAHAPSRSIEAIRLLMGRTLRDGCDPSQGAATPGDVMAPEPWRPEGLVRVDSGESHACDSRRSLDARPHLSPAPQPPTER